MARGEGGGRPPLEIDEHKIIKLARLCLNPSEIADVLNCSTEDLIKYKNLIEKTWPSDSEFKKVRFKRIRRLNNGLFTPKKLNRLRQAIRMHIADIIARELPPLENLIGYEVEDLIIDFIKKFKPGMSWDNWGKWHIDHIKPRSEFDSSQIKECFKLENLQPLWKHENLKKGGTSGIKRTTTKTN